MSRVRCLLDVFLLYLVLYFFGHVFLLFSFSAVLVLFIFFCLRGWCSIFRSGFFFVVLFGCELFPMMFIHLSLPGVFPDISGHSHGFRFPLRCLGFVCISRGSRREYFFFTEMAFYFCRGMVCVVWCVFLPGVVLFLYFLF